MSHLEDVWRPQTEKALWEADCGAEVARFESGHRVYRIPEDQASKLSAVPDGPGRWGCGYGVTIDTGYGPPTVFQLSNPAEDYLFEGMIGEWAALPEPKTRTNAPKRRRKQSE